MITWVMCSPVSAKNVPPNNGTPHSLPKAVTCSLLIRFSHSEMCRTTNARPPTMVARIHPTVALRFPWFMACTAITMVRLLDSRQNVITLEKMMLGEKGKGVGQLGVESRKYV